MPGMLSRTLDSEFLLTYELPDLMRLACEPESTIIDTLALQLSKSRHKDDLIHRIWCYLSEHRCTVHQTLTDDDKVEIALRIPEDSSRNHITLNLIVNVHVCLHSTRCHVFLHHFDFSRSQWESETLLQSVAQCVKNMLHDILDIAEHHLAIVVCL